MSRARSLQRPTSIAFDGEKILAEEGEPIAVALIAAGHVQLARSPKYHRPRGPSCLRGACDGCLARVDGEPNVMTCVEPVREGAVIETQNVLGSREIDLLRVTDWFFRQGFNHHELFAGVPGVQDVMQAFARRVAGLGTLPDHTHAPRSAERRALDALVVGGGPAGALAAVALASQGREVELVDDALELGGSARVLFPEIVRELHKSKVFARRAVAAGIFGDDVLVVSGSGAEVIRAKTVVLAPGAHDGALAFEGNDLPGIMSARAGAELGRRGVTLGRAVSVVTGDGVWSAILATLVDVEIVHGTPIAARGSSRVKGVTIETKDGERSVECDALFIDAPRAPAYELCAQAGAELRRTKDGWVAPSGKIREGFYAFGEVCGTPLVRGAIAAEIKRAL